MSVKLLASEAEPDDGDGRAGTYQQSN
jgi:hypothetical protein